MSYKYDDAKYGVIERFEFAAHQASKTLTGDTTLLKRFYPRGPIYIKKFGVRHIATQGGTEVTLKLSNDSTAIATVVASTDSGPWTCASKAVNATLSQGSYLTITSAGTVATGTVVCFIDYVRDYSGAGNWTHP